ncbi:hypothetical protein HDU97_005629 [Phlyctochytrium planicorne]|nr:hypothetical protein HDU97_005629 [Phlyctochytrium planicorne]
MASPSIVIYGSGLIGTYLGTSLATSTSTPLSTVHFIGRQRFTDKVQKANGLSVTPLKKSPSDPSTTRHVDVSSLIIHSSLKALKSGVGNGPDFVVVCVKRTASEDVAKELIEVGFTADEKARQGGEWYWKDTTLITMQNGAGAGKFLKSRLGDGVDVVEGMWPFNVVEGEEGHFLQTSDGPVYVFDSEKGRLFKEVLLAAGVDCKVSDNIENVLYGKLLMNLNNAICALSGIPLKAELSQWQYRTILSKCMTEALNVYAVAGIHPVPFTAVPLWIVPYILSLPDFLFVRIAASMVAIDEKARSSMYEDINEKRDTEIAYLQEEVSRLGRQHNVPTPVCDRIVLLVREAEGKKEGIVQRTGEEILGTVSVESLHILAEGLVPSACCKEDIDEIISALLVSHYFDISKVEGILFNMLGLVEACDPERSLDTADKIEIYETARAPVRILEAEYSRTKQIMEGSDETLKGCPAVLARLGALTMKLNAARMNAARDIFERTNATGGMGTISNERQELHVDLHGLHVTEAKLMVEQFVVPVVPVVKSVIIITGRGKHARDGDAVLKKAMKEFLPKLGLAGKNGALRIESRK